MDILRSELDLKDFVVLQCNTESIFPQKRAIKSSKALKELPVDIDFDLYKNEESNEFRIIIEVKVNCNEDKLPGYSIFVKCGSRFDLNVIDENEEDKKNALINSAVQITINSVRGYLWNVTSFGIYGRYTLPTINLPALMKAKAEKAE
ncbi:MAG TPA: hypothetical protein PLE74_11370 [Candidatus Cloacimonadota bacterium]|nr:hypothetical protein [Candidatus Cloacimonadota bacterium]